MTWIWPHTPGIGDSPWVNPHTKEINGPDYTVTWPGTSFYSPVVENWTYQIRKVQNGFILKTNGVEFVFETLESLSKKLEELSNVK